MMTILIFIVWSPDTERKQDWQYTYNVIWRCLRVPIVDVEKQQLFLILSVYMYVAVVTQLVYGLPVCILFFHIVSQTARFS